jgi:hypothetical protein
MTFIGEVFLFGPQNSLFWEFALLSSCTQVFGSLIVYRKDLPKKYL